MATLDLTKIGSSLSTASPVQLATTPVVNSTTLSATKPVTVQQPTDNTNYAGILAAAQQQALALQQQVATMGQTGTPPAGWDAETYKNFKAANPNLEPNAEDTARMQGAGQTSIQDYIKQISAVQQPNYQQTYTDAYNQSGLDKQKADVAQKAQVTTEAQGRLNNISAQLQALNTEAQAIPIQIQQDSTGRGRTESGIAPLQADALRANALKALPLQAQAAVIQAEVATAQGNQKLAQDLYTQAQDHFDKLFTLQMQDAQNKYESQTNLINQVYSFADKQEQRQLDAISKQTDRDFQLQLEDIRNTNDLNKIKLQDSLKSTDSNTEFISATANQPAGTFNKATGVFTPLNTSGADNSIAMKQATSKANIDEVSGLLTNTSLNSAVGPNSFARFSPIADLNGTKANFIAGVEQVRSKLNLDSLINAKSQGATFGALSDQELQVLASVATKIGTWAVKDKNGNVTGYNANEKDFKAELDKINNFAKLDYILKGGNPADVNAVQQSDGTYLVANSDGTYTVLK